jgi:hypothetical protein
MLEGLTQHLDLGPSLTHFATHGYARLGPVLSAEGAQALAERADALMLGEVCHPGLFFQHDSSSGAYEDLRYGAGFIGPSLAYRKLEHLEMDPLFAAWIENTLFHRIARAVLGDKISLYRAVLWNKVAGGGMPLPWHQDDGNFWGIDRPPRLQIWTALDDIPVTSGCVRVLPGSHHAGLATPQGGTVPAPMLSKAEVDRRAVSLPSRAGEALLLHNHVWHSSGPNRTEHPRRAFSVSYLHAETRCLRKKRAPRQFRRLFLDAPPENAGL